jgi:hypothetical protein
MDTAGGPVASESRIADESGSREKIPPLGTRYKKSLV